MGGIQRLAAAPLLLARGTVELIRRAETIDDLFATLNFKPKVLKVKLRRKKLLC